MDGCTQSHIRNYTQPCTHASSHVRLPARTLARMPACLLAVLHVSSNQRPGTRAPSAEALHAQADKAHIRAHPGPRWHAGYIGRCRRDTACRHGLTLLWSRTAHADG